MRRRQGWSAGWRAFLHCCTPRLPAAAKLDEVSRKISVLSSFTEKPAEPEEAAPVPSDAGSQASAAADEDEDEDDSVYDDGLDDNEGAGQKRCSRPLCSAADV